VHTECICCEVGLVDEGIAGDRRSPHTRNLVQSGRKRLDIIQDLIFRPIFCIGLISLWKIAL
jgi:hypothetical protein